MIDENEFYTIDNLKKSNLVINAKMNSTLLSERILYTSLLYAQQQKYVINEHNEFQIDMYPNDIFKSIGVKDGGSIYKSLDAVAHKLVNTTMGISNPETREFEYISLITDCKYENGIFSVCFNSRFENLVFALKGNYTKLDRQLMMSWRKYSSYKLYELLKQRAYYPNDYVGKKNGKFQYSVDLCELRFLLGTANANLDVVHSILIATNPPDYKLAYDKCPEKKFCTWDSFKRGILQPAIEEINSNENSDLSVLYEPRKKAHGEVYEIDFYIQLKKYITENNNNENDDTHSIKDGEIKNNIPQAEIFARALEVAKSLDYYKLKNNGYENALTLLEKADYDVERVIKAIKYVSGKEIKNSDPMGYLIKAIEEKYEQSIVNESKNKKSQFCNIMQHNYDYDEDERLFAKLNSYNEK